jgi:CRISPR-associated protein Cas5d
MFESVARGCFGKGNAPAAFFSPVSVEVLRPIRFEKYVTNYRGPLRKGPQIEKGASYQLPATVLVDVCYRVSGECIPLPNGKSDGVNAAHALQDMFMRRLSKGYSKYPPSLGWKEFLPSYFGPQRESTASPDSPILQKELNMLLPAFLLSVWDAPVAGNYRPVFRELEIKKGILRFPEVTLESGKIGFGEVSDAD